MQEVPVTDACLRTMGYPGYPLELYFQIPCVFPVQSQIFPVPIFIICDYYIHRTDLADLSSVWEKMEIFVANIAISFTFGIREFTNKIPCVFPVFWQNFQIPCVFPDRDFFLAIFPVFPVPWVPWISAFGSVGSDLFGSHIPSLS